MVYPDGIPLQNRCAELDGCRSVLLVV